MSYIDDLIKSFGQSALASGGAPITAAGNRSRALEDQALSRQQKAAADLSLTNERIIGQKQENINKEQSFEKGELAIEQAELNLQASEMTLLERAATHQIKADELEKITQKIAEDGMLEAYYNSESLPIAKDRVKEIFQSIDREPTESNVGELAVILQSVKYDFHLKEQEAAQKADKSAAVESRAVEDQEIQREGNVRARSGELRAQETQENIRSDRARKATNLSKDAIAIREKAIKQAQDESDPTSISGGENGRTFPQIIEEYNRLQLPGASEVAKSLGINANATASDPEGTQAQAQFAGGGVETTPAGGQEFNQFVDSQGGPQLERQGPQPLPSALGLVPRASTPEAQAYLEQNALVAEYKEFDLALREGRVEWGNISNALLTFLQKFSDSNDGATLTPDETEASLNRGRELE